MSVKVDQFTVGQNFLSALWIIIDIGTIVYHGKTLDCKLFISDFRTRWFLFKSIFWTRIKLTRQICSNNFMRASSPSLTQIIRYNLYLNRLWIYHVTQYQYHTGSLFLLLLMLLNRNIKSQNASFHREHYLLSRLHLFLGIHLKTMSKVCSEEYFEVFFELLFPSNCASSGQFVFVPLPCDHNLLRIPEHVLVVGWTMANLVVSYYPQLRIGQRPVQQSTEVRLNYFQ